MTTVSLAGIAGKKAYTKDRMKLSLCRDKIKFGGANKLKQKCLQRRCLLNTRKGGSGSGSINKPQSVVLPILSLLGMSRIFLT